MGRPPKRDLAKKTQGTFRKDRQTDQAAFGLVKKVPSPPDQLKDYAKTLWFETAKELIAAGVLRSVDLPMLGVYCQEMAKYWMYEELMRDDLGVQTTSTGYLAQTPYATLSEKAYKKADAVAAKFGLTPVDGQKIKATPPEKENDAAAELMK